jgi:hypothetical protein
MQNQVLSNHGAAQSKICPAQSHKKAQESVSHRPYQSLASLVKHQPRSVGRGSSPPFIIVYTQMVNWEDEETHKLSSRPSYLFDGLEELSG